MMAIFHTISLAIPGSAWTWFILAVVSRVLYVSYVWLLLERQRKTQWLTKIWGDRAYKKFRMGAIVVMNLDAVVFIIAVMRSSGEIKAFTTFLPLIGLAAILIGLTVKFSAAKVVGQDGYYWKDFFLNTTEKIPLKKNGIYRYLKNPMYGLGYLQTYGLALLALSLKGLVLAGFYQLMIKLFNYFVERKNFLRVYAAETGQ